MLANFFRFTAAMASGNYYIFYGIQEFIVKDSREGQKNNQFFFKCQDTLY